MKILGIVGSPRKNGNTDILVETALLAAKNDDIEVEKIYLSDYAFKGCIGCEGCRETFKCVIKDEMDKIYEKLDESDAIILGSPTYFYNVTSLTKAFIDRLYVYETFDEEDRSVWLSINEAIGMKYAITIATCEQESEEDLGYTSVVMEKSLQSVGYRVVSSIKALHVFKKGEVKNHKDILDECENSGRRLSKTLMLLNKIQKMKNLK